jgi:hypothetical protein
MAITIVQHASDSGGGAAPAAIQVNLPSPATPGNCLIAAIGSAAVNPAATLAVASVTTGPGLLAENWAAAATAAQAANLAAIWADPATEGGDQTITITIAGGNYVTADLYEVAGLSQNPASVTDQASSATGTGASWSSGATGITIMPSELVVGVISQYSPLGPGLTGPSSPWINEPVQTATDANSLSGYQIAAAQGAFTWAGTSSTPALWAAAAATFLPVLAGSPFYPPAGSRG